MYELWWVVANAKTCGGITSDFFIAIELHNGTTLSPFLFSIMMDEIIRAIQDEISYILFV